jgi:prevent-host-death family protein
MCYMRLSKSATVAAVLAPKAARRVGVRELRQNLSVHLERVIAGESLEVTARGRAVAMLIPLLPAATLVERLVAEGRAVPATRRIADPTPTPPAKATAAQRRRIWEALEETREDSR